MSKWVDSDSLGIAFMIVMGVSMVAACISAVMQEQARAEVQKVCIEHGGTYKNSECIDIPAQEQ